MQSPDGRLPLSIESREELTAQITECAAQRGMPIDAFIVGAIRREVVATRSFHAVPSPRSTDAPSTAKSVIERYGYQGGVPPFFGRKDR